MIVPEKLKKSQAFTLKEVIYNKGGFSIGIGKTIGNENPHLVMRWNGRKDDIGFPRAFNNPLWFPVSDEISQMFLCFFDKN